MRGKLTSDHGLCSFYERKQGAANGQDSGGVFQGCTGLWAAGYWLARRLRRLKASTDMDLGSFFRKTCLTLRNLGSFTKTVWSVICPLYRRQ